MTFKGDIDLGDRTSCVAHCTLSHHGEHLNIEIHFYVCVSYNTHKRNGPYFSPATFKCDLDLEERDGRDVAHC